jgi:hypothetical protein
MQIKPTTIKLEMDVFLFAARKAEKENYKIRI